MGVQRWIDPHKPGVVGLRFQNPSRFSRLKRRNESRRRSIIMTGVDAGMAGRVRPWQARVTKSARATRLPRG